MGTFLAALVVFGAAIAGLSIGVMLSGRCLQGTCGGISNLNKGDSDGGCELCSSGKSHSGS